MKRQRYEISKIFLTLQPQNWTRSLMDKIKDSGSLAQGSIPCGFTTYGKSSGHETAMMKAEIYDYDCILLDIMLPDGHDEPDYTVQFENGLKIGFNYNENWDEVKPPT